MTGYVKTDTVLDRILAAKAEMLQEAYREIEAEPDAWEQLVREAQTAAPPHDFTAALRKPDHVALIAEVKHASPSKGILTEVFDPVGLGMTYAQNGAAAISVLTDEPFFQGCLRDMHEVHEAVSVPVLRKDFIIDEYQIYEGRAAGADAMLLIVLALEDDQLAELHGLIQQLGMAALVEVHNEAELERALKAGATLIGVNNRDLKTFHEDLETTARLGKLVPPEVTLVAESAIRSLDDVRRMGDLGAHAVLVGEGLVKAENVAQQVRAFSGVLRGSR
jgi:indole-3-glycerol phosphate synthase